MTTDEELEEWKSLAGELRVQESRISGIIMDVNWDSEDQVKEALRAISEIIL